ncbi:D-lyxose/D-mannose family sugar isomerase [[Clostridium] cellulosi]|nr:MAG: D-lyxose/D-mannose family sugar isomerase [[Clostridium] cellulosi]
MISRKQYETICEKVLKFFEKASIAITEDEKKKIEVADFGLNDIENTGLQLVTFVNTDRVCAKEMVLFPHQTCPEHRHPEMGNSPGKEETFRCRYGKVYLYVEGEKTENPHCKPPAGSEQYYTVFHEIVLNPGEQYTIYPNTLHWFQAGDDGAIVSEFSTHSEDSLDIFTDVRIDRIPKIGD